MLLVKINGIPVKEIVEKISIETCSIHNYCVDQVAVWNNSPADYVSYMFDSFSSTEGIKHMFIERVNEVSSVGHYIHGVVSQLF